MIEVRRLIRTYGDLRAVDDVTFDIGRSEIVGLLGHNGAGKTTVMKMLTGYLEPSAGDILINELDIRTRRWSTTWSTRRLCTGSRRQSAPPQSAPASSAPTWDPRGIKSSPPSRAATGNGSGWPKPSFIGLRF